MNKTYTVRDNLTVLEYNGDKYLPLGLRMPKDLNCLRNFNKGLNDGKHDLKPRQKDACYQLGYTTGSLSPV